MPNHVINELVFKNVGPIKDELLGKILNQNGDVDFGILVPPPFNIWWGDVATIHEETFPGTFLDWAWKNWGTKWKRSYPR